MNSKREIIEADKKHVWHPFTQMKEYENTLPIVITKGKGVYLYDIDGHKYLDAISSWWVNTLGHSNKRINRALYKQANTLEHMIFAPFTHPWGVELAQKLAKLHNNSLTKVFYSDNGSTAVEVALKMAYQYWLQSGFENKSKFIALKNSYHGDTIGSVSVGGVDLYHKIFKPLLFDVYHAESPYCYRCPMNLDKTTCNIECVNSIEEILKEHSNEIAGIIIEPLIQAAGGMIIYPKDYLTKLRALCDKYNVLLIDDEVAMGFGRTGKMFAYQHTDIVPDIVCLAKGITAGYMPLSVTMTNEKIYNAFYDDWDKFKTFFHGHSYTANPLAISIALENLKILEKDKIIEKNQKKIERMEKGLEKFKGLEHVGDVRQQGMVAAIELVKDKITKEKYDYKLRMGHRVCELALTEGLLIRPLGDIIYFMPPYVIKDKEIDKMFDITFESIKAICE